MALEDAEVHHGGVALPCPPTNICAFVVWNLTSYGNAAF